jgi:hypothetical protein
VAGSIRSGRVIDGLSKLVSVHGALKYLRSDNGPEFVSPAILRWLSGAQIDMAHIDPGKPWQNGSNESFNGKFRELRTGGGTTTRFDRIRVSGTRRRWSSCCSFHNRAQSEPTSKLTLARRKPAGHPRLARPSVRPVPRHAYGPLLATPLSVAHLRPGLEALRPRLAAGLPFSGEPSVLHMPDASKLTGRNWEAGQEMAVAIGRGQVMVLETAPVWALSTPALVYEATVKNQVPVESPSIFTVVVAGLAMSRTWLSAPGVWP